MLDAKRLQELTSEAKEISDGIQIINSTYVSLVITQGTLKTTQEREGPVAWSQKIPGLVDDIRALIRTRYTEQMELKAAEIAALCQGNPILTDEQAQALIDQVKE